jgi:hypothetical protein
MPRRASKWLIQEHSSNNWELSRGGRSLYAGMGSEAELLQRLKNHHKPGEPIVYEDSSGLRVNITDRLRKRQVIS